MRPGYEWILEKPAPRQLPPLRRLAPKTGRSKGGLTWVEEPCSRCGHVPIGWRKRCPACLTWRAADPEAGHLGALEQYVWVVFLAVFVVLLARLVGMTF